MFSKKNILIIGHTFPEPTTTAAGVRMMQLIGLFLEKDCAVTFASTASISEKSIDLEKWRVAIKHIQINHNSFDTFIAALDPCVVVFDRFITEEQFGWRVAEKCPKAMRILDTEDLHFLRKARQTAYKENKQVNTVSLFTTLAQREIASILRCDVSLLISEFEKELLDTIFKIPKGIVCYAPFMISEIEAFKPTMAFEERFGFVTIGNLLHAPNVDSVLYLKKELWPEIRKKLPKVTLSIYGNYAPQQIVEMHDVTNGFLIKGWTPSVQKVMKEARVCLAPLRFGAGLKGKLIDAMQNGTPAVTTSIGAEGMYGVYKNAGGVADSVASFVSASVALYTQKSSWEKAHDNGFEILKNRFNKTTISEALLYRIETIFTDLDAHRNQHFVGQVLLHNTLQATKYMSKWIEAKNKI